MGLYKAIQYMKFNGEPCTNPEKQRRGACFCGLRNFKQSPLEETESSKYLDFSLAELW